jgi:hypothetical protein
MVWVIEHNNANTVMTDQIHAEHRTCENSLLDARTQITKNSIEMQSKNQELQSKNQVLQSKARELDHIQAEYRSCESNLVDARSQIEKLKSTEQSIRGDMLRKEGDSKFLLALVVSLACLFIAILSSCRK